MYTGYNITISDNIQEYTLNYSLEDHTIAQSWAEIIKNKSSIELRPTLHPWRGIFKNWDEKLSRLLQLISELNTWIPEKIQGEWNDDDINESLNRLHVHFPELEKSEQDPKKRDCLTEYNDLIHSLQWLYHLKNSYQEVPHLLICTTNTEFIDIPVDEYRRFNPNIFFGDLLLHYCHVGRHPYELLLSNDINCPEDQIIPQHQISAFHTLRFYDYSIRSIDWHKFYHFSGLKWPYKFNDPRLAFGYVKLGKLKTVNYKELTRQEIEDIVKNCNKILGWEIINQE